MGQMIWKYEDTDKHQWIETGDGEAARAAWKHHQQMKRDFNAGKPVEVFKPLGLVDSDTGEVLIKGFNLANAVKSGIIPNKSGSKVNSESKPTIQPTSAPPPTGEKKEILPLSELFRLVQEAEKEEDEQPTQEPPTSGEPPNPKKVEKFPYQGRMPFLQINISPDLYYLFVLAAAKFNLDFTVEEFSNWLTTSMYSLYILKADVFGINDFIVNAAIKRGVIK